MHSWSSLISLCNSLFSLESMKSKLVTCINSQFLLVPVADQAGLALTGRKHQRQVFSQQASMNLATLLS